MHLEQIHYGQFAPFRVLTSRTLCPCFANSCVCMHRALQTADIVFNGNDCERVVTQWAAERLEHASDVRLTPHLSMFV